MVVGAAGHERVAALGQRGGQRLRVAHDLRGVVAEFRPRRLAQRHRDRGGRVVVRAALQAGEDGAVGRLGVFGVRHDHRAARAAQGLVRGRGDHRGVTDGRRVRAAGDQAGDVRDVRHQHRVHLAGDLREGREVDRARDRGAAAEDQLRPLRAGQIPHLVHVDAAGVGADAVLHGAEPLAGHRQRHAHDRVARRGQRQVDGEVRRGAGVGLHVGVLHPEQRLRPVDRDRLDLVDELLALVVAPPGIPLGVLVRQQRPGRLEHGE